MIVTVEQLKQQINFTNDLGSDDNELIDRKISAAQDHIERLLGFKIEDAYGGEGQDEIPASLVEATCLLAAHWYENREASVLEFKSQELPIGVAEIIREYRTWSF
jgi:uncharacterized phage protein (predicted DNA packaging)